MSPLSLYFACVFYMLRPYKCAATRHIVHRSHRRSGISAGGMLHTALVQCLAMNQNARRMGTSLQGTRFFNTRLRNFRLQVSYPRGPIAAGLAVALVVTLTPAAAGAFVSELRVTTEASVFTLTLSARFIAPTSDVAAPAAPSEE